MASEEWIAATIFMNRKIVFVGFERGFHGRTLGAQQAGGGRETKSSDPALEVWLINDGRQVVFSGRKGPNS